MKEYRINCFKLFYVRKRINNISLTSLSKKVNISLSLLRKYEELVSARDELGLESFPLCPFDHISKIEIVLNSDTGYLIAGQKDDYYSECIHYYDLNKSRKQTLKKIKRPKLANCKIVVFDFDGTLTSSKERISTWETIWVKLGYSISECAVYHRKFTNNKITHKEWCDVTRDKFRIKLFSKKDAIEIGRNINLINGTKETLQLLHAKGIKMYLLSGSIKELIKVALGDLYDLFIDVKANRFIFDNHGIIREIIGTKYDFEGKAEYLKEIIKENNILSNELLYVGNSCNDSWAYESGAQTICVNPRFTDPHNSIMWTHYIRRMDNLEEIMKYVLPLN